MELSGRFEAPRLASFRILGPGNVWSLGLAGIRLGSSVASQPFRAEGLGCLRLRLGFGF